MAIDYSSASIPAQTPDVVETVSSIMAVDTIVSHKMLVSSIVVLISLLILEQAVYRSKKGRLPGAQWKIPIVGKFFDSMNPTMENYQKQWDLGPLSVVSVFHMFIVMASSNEYTRKVFNSPQYAEPMLVNAAPQIIEPDNWVFLNGKVHADYRRGLNALFTRKAIAIYLGIQDKIMREHFAQWLASQNGDHEDIMAKVRDLNMDTSLRVFCGEHIPAPAVKEITEQYWLITLALELVNFPLALPGTNVYNAIQSRKVAMKHLEAAARASKIAMASGAEPTCLIDEWVKEMNPDGKTKTMFSDHEMAQVVFSFLFASQDAMSSGTIYLFQHMADMPNILAKVREEHDRIRTDVSTALTLEDLDQMPYLRAVVKESMRVKPPVTMVPYKTTQPFPISDDYTIPAGCMVIPSIYPSTQDPEVYPQPEKLLPERWLDPNSIANQNPKNYLIFGSGPHRCIGQEYAILQMSNTIVTAAALMDWDHKITPDSEVVRIIATLFPKDGCLLKFRSRTSVPT
ncbi:RNA polymerase C-22 sterol desaturase [Tulasnella sp. 330]|nr:RNA polymerase C-22 sterol desaturase [Tulasnella sp. 330]KAG8885489.1 RNA polymerase C-22 sterol desaturase [Tulasnella sp. 331]